jgi:DNA repair protein RadD
MFELRPYQKEAVEAVYEHLRTRDDNPCVVLPTGTGKSLCIAQIVSDAVQKWSGRVLILAHVKELLEQNADKIQALCPELDVGVYSAGLNSRDTDHAVIVAGIQSVYNKACELGPFDLVIIDESHLLNSESENSMYKSFLNDMKIINPHVRLIGMTATPFRMKGGLICKPENLLNHVCYEAGLKEMIAQSYLSPLVSRAGRAEARFDNLHIRGGEFISSEVESLMDNSQLVDAACREIVSLTQERNSVLIFTSSVEHCHHVADKIAAYSGTECGIVTGSTSPGLRAEIIARFKGEEVPADFFSNKAPLKYLANVNVLTTGFDATNTDCIVLLRPTNSAGLLVQMVGRGTRLHPEKKDCLILDYGGNIMRHGPVDMIQVKESGSSNGEAPAKKCPECLALTHAAYMTCPECGYEFPPPEKSNITARAESAGVLSGQVGYFDYDVHSVEYSVHHKRGAPDDAPKTMRIEYCTGFNRYESEWVCPEHSGYARRKFEAWWKQRSKIAPPVTAQEAVFLADDGALAKPSKIIIKSVAGEKFVNIVDYELGELPDYTPEPGWNNGESDNWLPPNYPDESWDDDNDDIPF